MTIDFVIGWLYNHLLGADPRNAIALAGALLLAAAVTMIWIRNPRRAAGQASG